MIKKIAVLEYAKEEIIKFFDSQYKKGLEKYGVPLSIFNDRNAYNDAMQEVTDLMMYLQQLRIERDTLCWVLEYGLSIDELPDYFRKYIKEHSNEYRLHRDNNQ